MTDNAEWKLKKKTSGAQDLNKHFNTGSKQKNRQPMKNEETVYALIVSEKIRANCGKCVEDRK